MKTKLLAGVLMIAGTMFGQGPRVSVGVQVGPSFGAFRTGYMPPPPPARYVRRPPAPGRGYVWVAGYWYPQGNRYAWRDGYWVRPPYARARWFGPRYDRGVFIQGYWR
jgi:hypothetical protein